MMEAKLWAALCALLLITLGSAEHDNGHTTASNSSRSGGSEVTPNASAEFAHASSGVPANHVVASPNGPDTNLTSNVTSRLSNDTNSLTPKPKTDNGTNTVSPSEAAGPQTNVTDRPVSQSMSPLPRTHAPTYQNPLTSTTTSPARTDYTTPAEPIPTKTPPTTTLADSLRQTNETAHPKTKSFTSASTPEPPKLGTTTTTTTAQYNSTPSTSPSQETPKNSVSPSLTSPLNTLQPSGHPDTPSVAHQPSTSLPASSSSAQAKTHVNTPSQLNVGGDTTIVHEAPTLDPLLPGLVSAFIITAIIISLLLFLKLRRRDNRPEFRRLQDLPMDDMMEDTPLSMYSY